MCLIRNISIVHNGLKLVLDGRSSENVWEMYSRGVHNDTLTLVVYIYLQLDTSNIHLVVQSIAKHSTTL